MAVSVHKARIATALTHLCGARLAFGRVEIDHHHRSAEPGKTKPSGATHADTAAGDQRATLPVNSIRHFPDRAPE